MPLRERQDWWSVAFYAGYIAALETVQRFLAELQPEGQRLPLSSIEELLENMKREAELQLSRACTDSVAFREMSTELAIATRKA